MNIFGSTETDSNIDWTENRIGNFLDTDFHRYGNIIHTVMKVALPVKK
jgi:hypothetical protein